MTGTGLKKCKPLVHQLREFLRAPNDSPTTRLEIVRPSSLAALTPSGIADAAILVILIELVLVASMASGFNSEVNDSKIFFFIGRDSDTA